MIFQRLTLPWQKKARCYFGDYCAECHLPIDRKDPSRKIIAQMADVGTDRTMSDNVTSRRALTGRLEGQRMNFNPIGDKFGAEASGEEILTHEIAGAILGSWKAAPRDELYDIMIPEGESAALVDTSEAKYKARPLNGIWSTAPYLHNGSVPNLYQLLLPVAERQKKFWGRIA